MATDPGRASDSNTFVHRIYSIISDPAASDSIAWTESGLSFAINDLQHFSSEILPKYFRHKNFSSFVRQLNMYGFRKERETGDVQIFSHPNFVKGKPEQLKKIARRCREFNNDSGEKRTLNEKFADLKDKQKGLKEKVKALEMEVKGLQERNQYMMAQLMNCMEKEKRIEGVLMTFVQKVKEIPYALDECMFSIFSAEKTNGQQFMDDFSRFHLQ
jgi:hypothetical protein